MTFPDDIEFTATCNGTGFGDDDWQRQAFHWTIVMRYDGRSFQTSYWMGSAHVEKVTPNGNVVKGDLRKYHGDIRRLKDRPIAPKRDEVLASLASDVRLGQETFVDFCGDLGYDTDSRKALHTWEACVQMGIDLQRLFGRDFRTFTETEWDE